jgi:hypothetical protein
MRFRVGKAAKIPFLKARRKPGLEIVPRWPELLAQETDTAVPDEGGA